MVAALLKFLIPILGGGCVKFGQSPAVFAGCHFVI
jgi:hypothetical protein